MLGISPKNLDVFISILGVYIAIYEIKCLFSSQGQWMWHVYRHII
jgi:hypothetical protein